MNFMQERKNHLLLNRIEVSTMWVPKEFDAEHIKSTSSESSKGSVVSERPFTYRK
jgi:hypothetical protein